MYLWLIHVNVWQKPTQHYKALTLQLKLKKKKFEITRDGKKELPLPLYPLAVGTREHP